MAVMVKTCKYFSHFTDSNLSSSNLEKSEKERKIVLRDSDKFKKDGKIVLGDVPTDELVEGFAELKRQVNSSFILVTSSNFVPLEYWGGYLCCESVKKQVEKFVNNFSVEDAVNCLETLNYFGSENVEFVALVVSRCFELLFRRANSINDFSSLQEACGCYPILMVQAIRSVHELVMKEHTSIKRMRVMTSGGSQMRMKRVERDNLPPHVQGNRQPIATVLDGEVSHPVFVYNFSDATRIEGWDTLPTLHPKVTKILEATDCPTALQLMDDDDHWALIEKAFNQWMLLQTKTNAMLNRFILPGKGATADNKKCRPMDMNTLPPGCKKPTKVWTYKKDTPTKRMAMFRYVGEEEVRNVRPRNA